MLFTIVVTLNFSEQFHVINNTIFHTKYTIFLLNEISVKYSWFHIKGTWSVHSFNGDYLSILKCTGSCGYLFREIPGMWNFLLPKLAIMAYPMRKISKFPLCEISHRCKIFTKSATVSYSFVYREIFFWGFIKIPSTHYAVWHQSKILQYKGIVKWDFFFHKKFAVQCTMYLDVWAKKMFGLGTFLGPFWAF